MQPIIITTVVRNPMTLPLLLSLTDNFVERGLLTKLRVVDETPDAAGTIAVRSLVPMDGVTNTRKVVVNYSTIRQKDPRAYISTGLTGYHYKTTGFNLVQGGDPVVVAVRGSHGASIWVSSGGRGAGGVEVVMNGSGCFIRTGRGGGDKLSEIPDSGVVDGGTGWRTVELALVGSEFIATLDTGTCLKCGVDFGMAPVGVNISSSPVGIADIVVTSLPVGSLGPDVDRSYACYYKSRPPADESGFELVSNNDIVYIDPVGWENLFESGIILAVGDAAHLPAVRRAGIAKSGTSDHESFLDRSFRCTARVEQLWADNISFNIESGTHILKNGSRIVSGPPVLVCVLEASRVDNLEVIKRYSSLLESGPVGEPLDPAADDVIAYLDSILADPKADEFLIELVESLNQRQKSRLVELLSRS